MSPPQIPDHVMRFIAENIDSVPQLEALLLLSEHPDRTWNAEQVALRIYVHSDKAESLLAALHRRRLIERREDLADSYQFSAADEARRLVAEVNGSYRANVVVLTRFIHENASASVREFARAFDLKKDH
jgi:DNA-binding MarR family transcriptional regulator